MNLYTARCSHGAVILLANLRAVRCEDGRTLAILPQTARASLTAAVVMLGTTTMMSLGPMQPSTAVVKVTSVAGKILVISDRGMLSAVLLSFLVHVSAFLATRHIAAVRAVVLVVGNRNREASTHRDVFG